MTGKQLSLFATATIVFLAGSAFFIIESQRREIVVRDLRPTPSLRIILESKNPEASPRAEIEWDGTRRLWRFAGKGFSAPPSGKDYQVWIVDPLHTRPVSCGIIKPDAAGKIMTVISPREGVSQMKGFFVSLEKTGANDEPKGEVILTSL